MPEQTELVNYYLSSLQDNLAHIVKEKALDEAKLNFKDAEMGELQQKIEEGKRQLELLNVKITELETKNSELEKSVVDLATYQNTVVELEHKLQQTVNRCATLTAKVDQAHRDLKERDAKIEKLKETKKTTTRRRKKVVNIT
jgi:flagellar biosynthesis chaperone FliJ